MSTIRLVFFLALHSTLCVFLCFPTPALSASGGRMGGTSPPPPPSSPSSNDYHSSPSDYYYSSPSRTDRTSPNVIDATSVNGGGGGGSPFSGLIFFLIFLGSILGFVFFGDRTSVVKLQVCLSGGMPRSVQKDLDEIAKAADTSNNEGLNFVLKETLLALLRHPESCISAYSSVDIKRSFVDGEKHFNQLSLQEREKFDDETHVNVNNIKRKKDDSKVETEKIKSDIQYLVVTIVVVVSGGQKLPIISSTTDLKEALQILGSVSSKKVKAVEVLWTPQLENENLSEEKLLEDYPCLRPLHDHTEEFNPKLD